MTAPALGLVTAPALDTETKNVSPAPLNPVRLNLRKKSLKTDLVVISDVHLGSDVSRAKDLRKALAEWYPFNRLIILGDLFDDLNFARLKKHHFGLLDDFRRLSNPKRGVKIDWIEGNHDEGAEEVIPHMIGATVHKEIIEEIYGQIYLFIHGHQFDDFLNDHPVVSTMASRFYESIQKREGEELSLSRWLKKKSKKWLSVCQKIEMRAINYASERAADVIMCGHTHYYDAESHHPESPIKYINTGCWADRPATLTTVDGEGLKRHLYI